VEDDGRGGRRVRRDIRHLLPQRIWVTPDGRVQAGSVETAIECAWVPAPFRFCLFSGAAYAPTMRSDIAKMSTLGFEGRSTSTTMLTLAVLRYLEADGHDVPQKLLDFTDNRQDAALQAGHFNDFVQVGLLRAALYQAIDQAGLDGLDYLELPRAVQSALGLELAEYAQNPEARYAAREEIDRALREVLGYHLYVDSRLDGGSQLPILSRLACSASTTPGSTSSAATRRRGPQATRRSPAPHENSVGRSPPPCSTTFDANSRST